MKRIYVRILVLAAIVGALSWAVVTKVSTSAATEKQGKKQRGDKPVLVTTHTVEPTTLRDVLSTVGTLRPEETITVRNEVAGKLVEIGFKEGDRVERGDVLLRMRSDTIRASLEVERTRHELLQTKVDRLNQVLDKGGVSQQEFDEVRNELAVTRAEIERIRTRLDQTIVRAPFDGVIGLRQVSPGAVLTVGSPVATLRKLDKIDVEFTVPERYAPAVQVGDQVRFRVHGDQRVHEASVSVIEPGLEPSNRTLRVQARADNTDGTLRPGAYAQVRVLLENIEGALTVPAPALTISGGSTHLWVDVDGQAKKRTVETGYRTEDEAEITDGVSAGEVVVVTGHQSLKPGARLEVDTSADAMDVDEIAPDTNRTGMRNKWFSEETVEDRDSTPPADEAQANPDQAEELR